jgi:large conductance mechanosensitive channel
MSGTSRSIRPPSWLNEFKAFIMRGSVVDLAVGIVIGAAFTGVVNSLVKDIINPVIGLLIGGIDFSNLFVALNGKHYATLAAAKAAGAATMNVGLFINAIIQFLIVSFAIFWVIKALTRLKLHNEPAPPSPPAPSPTETLLAEIRDLLKVKPTA